MFYQIFIQSFYDSNGDGIGDLNGVTAKLDYLKELGIEGIWLMPLHPSPSYHKYDVTDYYDVHQDYGTLSDVKNLVKEAHKRNIAVIIDLVINHCSALHPWFQEAIKGKDNPYRDYFIWATDKQIEASGTATKEVTEDSDNVVQWNAIPGRDEKYFAYFWEGMPDLNYDNPKVRKEIHKVGRFWLELGIDGFRLDAAMHIYPDDRAEDSHQFWTEFREEMEKAKPDVFLVGEIWHNASTIAPYLKGLKSAFNFDLGYSITDAVKKCDSRSLIETYLSIRQTYEATTENYIDATFIKNHDQNRILSEVRHHEDKAKMAAALLLTLPGLPFIYYGEEIGMRGRKPDQFIREPFLWSHFDKGQTSWTKAKYNLPGKVKSLSEQFEDDHSFYQYYKKFIALRHGNEVLKNGSLEALPIKGKAICAFRRVLGEQHLEVYHNLSPKNQIIKSEGINVVFASKEPNICAESIKLQPFSTVILQ